MKKKRNVFLSRALLGMLCSSAIAATIVNASDMTMTHASADNEISLTGIQMRGTANGWYYYLVLLSDSYTGGTSTEVIENYSNYLSGDKIRLYLSETDTTGKSLSELTLQHVAQNQWGEKGCFINYAEYDSTYGGHQVYKVTVEKGCSLPFEKDGIVSAYSVDVDYTFINSSYGDETKKIASYDWTMSAETRETVSLDGVQLRGAHGGDLDTNSWYHYLAISSPSFSGMSVIESSVEMGSYSSTLDKIRLYKVGSDGELVSKTLAELGVNHSERNKWGTTSIMFAFDEFKNGWDGISVYKVEIEKDCVLVANVSSYTQKFVVDKDYVFYNSNFGKTSDDDRFGALSWTSSPTLQYAVDEETISLNGIQLRGYANLPDNSWYHYLVLKTDAYQSFSTQDSLTDSLKWSDFSGVKLYTKNENGTLNEKGITSNHVGTNLLGETGAFIGFDEYKNGFDGTSVYKVFIKAGTKIAAGLSENGEKARVFVTDKDYTFYNSSFGDQEKKYGAFDWTSAPTLPYASEETTISLSGVQLRGVPGDDSSSHYLVLESDAYNDLSLEVESLDGYESWSDFSGIKMFISQDGSLVEKTITVNRLGMNKWGVKGAFIAFNEYKDGLDGTSVYKMMIPAGTKIYAGLDGEKARVFVTDKDYVFYNSSFGNADAKFGSFAWTNEPTVPYTLDETSISLSGVQLRGDASLPDNSWYHYLVLLSDAFKDLRKGVDFGASALKWCDLSGIKLYAKGADGSLEARSPTFNHEEMNKWGAEGAFLAFDEYKNGLDGTSVYRIDIASGTKFVAGMGEKAKVFVVDKDYSFINKEYGKETVKFGAFNWLDYVPEETTFSISGVQLRGFNDNSWYQYLVLLSDDYKQIEARENSTDTSDFFTGDKIRLYLNGEDEGKTLSELGVQHIDQSFSNWSTGAYINFKDFEHYNGNTVYRVSIEKGCQVPVIKDGKIVLLKTDKDYSFYNVGYGDESKTYGSYAWWISPLPKTVETTGDISIRNVTNQSDGVSRWIILYFNEKFVGTTDVTFYDTRKFSNILDSIYLYSGNDLSKEPIKLRDVFAGAITIGQFGSPDAIGFLVKNEEEINGSNLYATVIKEGCEVPFTKDGKFSKRTVGQEMVFLNDNYGKKGEIPGETGSDSRTYENWAINSTKSVFVDYKVVGIEKSFSRELLASGTKIDASKFMVEGYQLTITDNLGFTYYGEIVLPDQNVEITLTYSKLPSEEPKPAEDKEGDNIGLILGLSVGGLVVVVAGLTTFFVLRGRKKEI